MDFEQAPGAPTHYVVSGEAWLERPGADPLRLGPGDLVMFPRWDRHVLHSGNPATPLRTIRDVVRANEGPMWRPGEWLDQPLNIALDGDGARTRMLSLVFELDESGPHPLLLGLPPLIHVRSADLDMAPWLQTVLHFLSGEATARRAGYAAVSSRLADLLFIQIVRSQLLTRPGEVAGWLRALVDPALGPAIAALHEHPGEDWSLPRLARRAGLSRSTLYERFLALTGTTPARYVHGVRMEAAATRLSGGARVKAVAAELGYATPYAFANAFRRAFGVSPGSYGAATTAGPGGP